MTNQIIEKKNRKRKSPEAGPQSRLTKKQHLDTSDIATTIPIVDRYKQIREDLEISLRSYSAWQKEDEIVEEYDLLREYLDILIPSFAWQRVQTEDITPKYASMLMTGEQAKFIAKKLQDILREATIEVYPTKDSCDEDIKEVAKQNYRVAITKINTKYLQTMARSLQKNRIVLPVTDPKLQEQILASSIFEFPSLLVYRATLETFLPVKHINSLIQQQQKHIKLLVDSDLPLDKEIPAIKKLVNSLRDAKKNQNLGDCADAIFQGDYWLFHLQACFSEPKNRELISKLFSDRDLHENIEIIRELIVYNADLNSIFIDTVFRPKRSASLKLLVASGVKINQFFHHDPLSLLIKIEAPYDSIQFLIAAECNLNTEDIFNSPPLHHAIKQGRTNLVKLLIREGAIMTLNHYGINALALAIMTNAPLSLIELLVAASPLSVLQKNFLKDAPLHLAVMNLTNPKFENAKQAKLIEYLIKIAPQCLYWENLTKETPQKMLLKYSSVIHSQFPVLASYLDAPDEHSLKQLCSQSPSPPEIKLFDNKEKHQTLEEKKFKTTTESPENSLPQTLYHSYISSSSDSELKQDKKSQHPSKVVNLLPDDEDENIAYDLPLKMLKILIPNLNWQRVLEFTLTYEVINLSNEQAVDIMAQLQIAFAGFPVGIDSPNNDDSKEVNLNSSSDKNNCRVYLSGVSTELLKVAAPQLLQYPVFVAEEAIIPNTTLLNQIIEFELLPYICMFDYRSEEEYTKILLAFGVSRQRLHHHIKQQWDTLDQLIIENSTKMKDTKENSVDNNTDSGIAKLAADLQKTLKSKDKMAQRLGSESKFLLAKETWHLKFFTDTIYPGNYWLYKAWLKRELVNIENLLLKESKGFKMMKPCLTYNSNIDIVKDVIAKGAPIHSFLDPEDANQHLEIYEKLTDNDNPSNLTPEHGNSLHTALYYNDFNIANLLISAGVDINKVSSLKIDNQQLAQKSIFLSTPLALATYINFKNDFKAKEQLETVQLLVESGAEINTIFVSPTDDPPPTSALRAAAEAGNYPIVRYLVKKGADLDFIDGSNLLDAAFSSQMTAELFIYLVDVLKLSLLQPNRFHITPLALLTRADSSTGRTLLHDWAEQIAEDPKFCYVFIWLGCHPNFCGLYRPDKAGDTPMAIIAAKNQSFAQYFEARVLPLTKKLQREKIQFSQTSSLLSLTHDSNNKDKQSAELLTSGRAFFNHSNTQPPELTHEATSIPFKIYPQ